MEEVGKMKIKNSYFFSIEKDEEDDDINSYCKYCMKECKQKRNVEVTFCEKFVSKYAAY
jgi:hypothetical protein